MQAINLPRRLPLTKRGSRLSKPEEKPAVAVLARCPFVATTADATTALAFVSDANHCYSSGLPVPVSATHQESYCLTAEHGNCPIFQSHQQLPVWDAPLPAAATTTTAFGETFPLASLNAVSAAKERVSPMTALMGLMALVVLVGGWWLWRDYLAPPQPAQIVEPLNLNSIPDTISEAPVGALPAVAEAAVELPGQQPAAPIGAPESGVRIPAIDLPQIPGAASAGEDPVPEVPAIVAAVESPTPSPTATAENVVVENAATCRAPRGWTPYEVQVDDTLFTLAGERGLEVNEILVANCLNTVKPPAGQIIMLPPVGIIAEVVPSATAVVVGNSPATTAPSASPLPAVLTPFPTPFPLPTATNAPAASNVPPTAVPVPTNVPPTNVPLPTSAPPTSVPPTNPPPTSPPPTNPPPAATATPPQVVATREPTATPPSQPDPQPTRTPPSVP